MRIISCGDIHMSADQLTKIPEIESVDLIIINGDLTNYGFKKEAKQVLDFFYNTNPNLLAQVGNLDHMEIDQYLEQLNINIHGQARLFKERVCLVGIGGSNTTPFSTPTEFSEQELQLIGEKAFRQAADFIHLAEPIVQQRIPTILVTHTPPFGTQVDELATGQHVGSKTIRDFIEQKQPDLCITGHIHEATATDKIGNTPIINPGMLCKGGYIDIIINNSTIQAQLQNILP